MNLSHVTRGKAYKYTDQKSSLIIKSCPASKYTRWFIFNVNKYIDLSSQQRWLYTTCQKRISCTVLVFGSPSGHIGITTYTANLSLALILLAIFNANSMGIRLSAPAHHNNGNNLRTCVHVTQILVIKPATPEAEINRRDWLGLTTWPGVIKLRILLGQIPLEEVHSAGSGSGHLCWKGRAVDIQ